MKSYRVAIVVGRECRIGGEGRVFPKGSLSKSTR